MINAKVVYNLAWRLLVTATTQMLYQAQQYEMVYERWTKISWRRMPEGHPEK
jgi:hypothetical protein